MLTSKSTKIFSETKNFFTSSEKGIIRIMDLYKSFNLNRINLGVKEPAQSTFRKGDILLAMLLFPLFSLSNVYSYTKHSLSESINASKNTFYRFKSNSMINWRGIVEKCNKKLFRHLPEPSKESIKCLIIDDTDFEKTTYKTEHISRIWSHVKHSYILGFKGLFVAYWDGSSLFSMDFSLHKERGKNKKKPYGLTPKQRSKQYSKQRKNQSYGKIREKELLTDKISMAIDMIERCFKKKLKVDYILADSWFFCEALLIKVLALKTNMIAMAKMGKAKYTYQDKEYTAKELAHLMKQRKKVKKIKPLNMYCAELEVIFKNKPLKLYFCKTSKRGKWHLLVSTNMKLGILQAYKIYSTRWSIEVFFKEAKQYFGIGKSRSQDFDAQIADISIAMIEYNVFSLAKRFESYETLGGLFEQVKDQATELTIVTRIWKFILELLQLIAEIFNSNFNELIINIIKNKPEENKIYRLIEMQIVSKN